MRIFQSSKQFREGKPMEYYEKMAEKSLGFVAGVKDNAAKALPIGKTPKNPFGKNGKV